MSGGNITVTNSNVLPYIVITYPYVGSRKGSPLCAKTQKFLIREKELRIVAASKYVLHLNFRISFQLFFLQFSFISDNCLYTTGHRCINGACLDSQCHCNDGWGGKGCSMPDDNECKYR